MFMFMASISSMLNSMKETMFSIRHDYELRSNKISPEDEIIRKSCEESLYNFVKHAWNQVEGENPYSDNWHIKAICDHLEACVDGRIKFLNINIPPRCMKSLICNIFFPAWVWLKRPSAKIFCLSGSHKLAVRDSVKCRSLMQSVWYQNLWGNVFAFNKDVNTKERYSNNKGGEKLVKSILGSSIGEGGHFLIIDDGNSQQDITSKTTRDRTNEIVDSSFLIRQDNTERAVVINIQQRLHWEDLTAHLLEKNLPGSVHLMLPMEYEPHRACVTIPLKGMKEKWHDPRTKKDELLWPSRFTPDHVARLKIFFGSPYNIASQLQQLPAPESGNIFQKEWFKVWKQGYMPRMDMVIQSWDTALSIGINACESALTTWGIFTDDNFKKNIMFMNSWHGRLEQPDLRKMIKKCARNYYTMTFEGLDRGGPEADIVLIEEASGGLAMIQDLRSSGLPIFGFNPRHHKLPNFAHMTNKADRARLASIVVEQGLVWLPANPSNPSLLMKNAQFFLHLVVTKT
jgi:phage terminase large subunit-like protein